MLDAHRGRPPLAVDAFCKAAAKLSVMAVALDGLLQEVDLNPIIVTPSCCVAVDALLRINETACCEKETRLASV